MKSKLLLLVAFCLTLFSVNAQITSVAVVGNQILGTNWPDNPGNPGPEDNLQMAPDAAAGPDNWILDITVLPQTTGAADRLGFKLRANNVWDAAPGGNWGIPASGSQYPSGTCVNAGSSGDFRLVPAGTYTLKFNSATGAYIFLGGQLPPVVTMIGTAIAPATSLLMNTVTLSTFELRGVTLAAGTLQFQIDSDIAGGTEFPGTTGAAGEPTTALGDSSVFIPVTAGKYDIQLDANNGLYSFVLIPEVVTYKITIVGGATPINFPPYANGIVTEDTQKMINASNDNENYYFAELPLTVPDGGPNGSGKIKFRVNNDWPGAFGGGSFPAGPTAAGDDIIVTTAGTYSVDFVRSTGAYNFFTPKISLTGDAFLGWGNDIFLDTTDGITYTKSNVVATSNIFKFRLDGRYNKAWGPAATGSSWPSGIGNTAAGGNNLNAVAGTYNVTFNRLTEAYAFTTPNVSTVSFAAAGFKVAPNPTQNVWSFSSSKEAIVSIQIVDMLGKVVVNTNSLDVDASALTYGVYFAKVNAANATETVKLVKN